MNRARVCLVALGVPILCLILISAAWAQVWDNKWFRVKGKATGYVVKDDGNLSRNRFSGTSYIFFHWDHYKQRYDLTHWVQNASGQWLSFQGIFQVPVGNQEILWRDIYTRLQRGDDWIWIYASARLRLDIAESGAIENARFKTMGCESPMGSVDGQNFGGKCKVKGKMIDPSSLPFVPTQ